MHPSLIREIAGRYTDNSCGKTAPTTKYGCAYTLVCQQQADHAQALCRDIDNGTWFEPMSATNGPVI